MFVINANHHALNVHLIKINALLALQTISCINQKHSHIVLLKKIVFLNVKNVQLILNQNYVNLAALGIIYHLQTHVKNVIRVVKHAKIRLQTVLLVQKIM